MTLMLTFAWYPQHSFPPVGRETWAHISLASTQPLTYGGCRSNLCISMAQKHREGWFRDLAAQAQQLNELFLAFERVHDLGEEHYRRSRHREQRIQGGMSQLRIIKALRHNLFPARGWLRARCCSEHKRTNGVRSKARIDKGAQPGSW